MLVWVPEGTDTTYLECLPDDVDVGFLPASSRDLGSDAGRVEFLIASWIGDRDIFRDQLAQMTSLKVIQSYAAGVEHLRPLIPPGVTFCNGKGLHDSSVGEWCVGAILANYNRLSSYVRQQDLGKWNLIETQTLEGSTVTILGYGSIGKAVARRLAPFNVTIHGVGRTSRSGDDGVHVHSFDELEELLPGTDILIDLLPNTPLTQKLVNAMVLSALPAGALVINAGRGKTVDTDALIAELSTGRLSAVLDVTDPEPIPEGHPLWSTPNLLLTQHSSGNSVDYLEKVYPFIHQQIHRYMNNEPLLNVVTGDY